MEIFEKFKLGFKKSASSLSSGLRDIIIKKEIDDNTLNKIEEFGKFIICLSISFCASTNLLELSKLKINFMSFCAGSFCFFCLSKFIT